MRTNEGTCIRDYLKKLTPYIIIWLAGFFPDVDPIQDKKIRLKKRTLLGVGTRQTLYVALRPMRQKIKRRMRTKERQTDRRSNKERKRENVMRALGVERGHNLANDST